MNNVIPKYNLSIPTEEGMLTSLERVLGHEDAHSAWAAARRAVGLRTSPYPLTIDQLNAVAGHLAVQPGLVSVLGRALQIRIQTYECLSTSSAFNGANN